MSQSIKLLWDLAAVSGLFAVIRRPGVTLLLVSSNLTFTDLRAASAKMLTEDERNVMRDHLSLPSVSDDPECVAVVPPGFDESAIRWQTLLSGLRVPAGFDLTGFMCGGYNQDLQGLSEAEGGEPRGSPTGAERKPAKTLRRP